MSRRTPRALFAIVLAAAAALPSVARAQRIRMTPGVAIGDKVVVRVNVTLFDADMPYVPVGDHRLALIGPGGDTTAVTTDEAGTATALVPPGEYTLASLRSVEWRGQRYRWSVPLAVQPGVRAVALTPGNATLVRQFAVEAQPDTTPPAAALEPTYLFASIPWGVSADSAQKLLMDWGITYSGMTADGSRIFRGTLLNHPADVTVHLRDGKTAKVSVLLLTPPGEARRTYDSLKALLTAKHGAPATSREPAAGDTAAPPADTARTITSWTRENAPAPELLTLELTPGRRVLVAYESPAWAGGEQRRPTGAARGPGG